MIRFKLSSILGDKRIDQKGFSYLTGISTNSINQMYHEKIQGIKFDSLDAICRVLHCQPGDLLEYVPDNKKGQNNRGSAEKGKKDTPGKKRGLFGF